MARSPRKAPRRRKAPEAPKPPPEPVIVETLSADAWLARKWSLSKAERRAYKRIDADHIARYATLS